MTIQQVERVVDVMEMPFGTLVSTGDICEKHKLPKLRVVQPMREGSDLPVLSHSSCQMCCIKAAREMDGARKRYFAALLLGGMGQEHFGQFVRMLEGNAPGFTEDDRLVACVQFTADQHGRSFEGMVADMLITWAPPGEYLPWVIGRS